MSALVVLAALLVVMGLLFCVLPVIPGPLLSYGALILLSIRSGWELFSVPYLVIMGVLMVLVSTLDNILPILTARQAGGTKAGMWGSIVGMFVGIFFFPPVGLFLGTLVGAVAGEAIFNPGKGNPLKAGWGVFLGTLLGIGLKVAYSGYIAWVFVRTVF